jgi:hypothetical protein
MIILGGGMCIVDNVEEHSEILGQDETIVKTIEKIIISINTKHPSRAMRRCLIACSHSLQHP